MKPRDAYRDPEEIKRRLDRADAVLEALQSDEVDAVVRKQGVAMLRLREVEEQLRRSEARYRELFTHMVEGFALHELVYDKNGEPCDYRFLEVNPAFEQLTGLKRNQILGRTARDVLSQIEPEWIAKYADVVRSGESAHFTSFSEALQRWYEVSAYRAASDQFAIVFTDVTTRKESEERLRASLNEKDVLLREIHHRVKNNMQVVSSLVSLQADAVADDTVREAMADVSHRVRSMAMVHEKLYQSVDLAHVDFAAYAEGLLRYLWTAHATEPSEVRLKTELEAVPLPVNTAIPCGLILNELVSNALKHAFQGRSGGEVTVALVDREERIRLSVRDDGVGFPDGMDWRTVDSLGMRLVRMLADQIGADLRVSSDRGTDVTLIFGVSGE